MKAKKPSAQDEMQATSMHPAVYDELDGDMAVQVYHLPSDPFETSDLASTSEVTILATKVMGVYGAPHDSAADVRPSHRGSCRPRAFSRQ